MSEFGRMGIRTGGTPVALDKNVFTEVGKEVLKHE